MGEATGDLGEPTGDFGEATGDFGEATGDFGEPTGDLEPPGDCFDASSLSMAGNKIVVREERSRVGRDHYAGISFLRN